MRCKVAYWVGDPPRWFTRELSGILWIDDGGFRIEGPVPYRADFAEMRALEYRKRPGLSFIAIRFASSPPVFLRPFLFSFLRFVWVVDPRLNNSVYTELRRCGPSDLTVGVSVSGGRSRDHGKGRRLGNIFALAVLLALFTIYVGSYYHLSRRGMREAKVYSMHGFLYEPAEVVFAKKDLSRHHALATLYAPLNIVDQAVFGADGPVRDIMWGLSK
jgi:hypothetical protein